MRLPGAAVPAYIATADRPDAAANWSSTVKYRFKGRGILWHDDKGPVAWWPLNWLWFFVIDAQMRRRDAREAAEAVAKDRASERQPSAARAPDPHE